MAKNNKPKVEEEQFDETQEKANLEQGKAADVDDATEEKVGSGVGEVYTYVGNGEAPPRRINFMGKQVFSRGVATKVTHPDVLKKLPNHPCFVKGEVDQDAIHDADEEANKLADQQRQKDNKLNASVLKKMASWGKKGEDE